MKMVSLLHERAKQRPIEAIRSTVIPFVIFKPTRNYSTLCYTFRQRCLIKQQLFFCKRIFQRGFLAIHLFCVNYKKKEFGFVSASRFSAES